MGLARKKIKEKLNFEMSLYEDLILKSDKVCKYQKQQYIIYTSKYIMLCGTSLYVYFECI